MLIFKREEVSQVEKIRIRFDTDAPESYKLKTIKKVVALGWVQSDKKVQLIPARDDPNQNVRDITFFFYWPHESEVVYPKDVEFSILS